MGNLCYPIARECLGRHAGIHPVSSAHRLVTATVIEIVMVSAIPSPVGGQNAEQSSDTSGFGGDWWPFGTLPRLCQHNLRLYVLQGSGQSLMSAACPSLRAAAPRQATWPGSGA